MRQSKALAERIAYLTRHANDIMLFCDQDWRIVEANERAVAAYGYTHEELLGLSLRDLQTGDDKWLLSPVTRDDQESASTRDLMPVSSFTPDSKALVTSFEGRIWRVAVPEGQATPIPFSADVDLALGPRLQFDYRVDEGPVRAQQIRYPRLSPDGQRLALTPPARAVVID